MVIDDSLKKLYDQICKNSRKIDKLGLGFSVVGYLDYEEHPKIPTDYVFRNELSRFLLFVANGNGVLTEDELGMIRFTFGETEEKLDLFIQKFTGDSTLDPKKYFSLYAAATGENYGKEDYYNIVFSAFVKFGQAILLCDPDPVSQKRYDDFIQGMQSLKIDYRDVGNLSRLWTKLRHTLKLGENLDATGEAGAKKLTNGEWSSPGLVRFELARFLYYISEDQDRMSEEAKDLICMAYGCSKDDPKLVAVAEMAQDLKAEENMVLIAFLSGDAAMTLKRGKKYSSYSDNLIDLFTEFGYRMLYLTDSPDIHQQHFSRCMDYIDEMKNYAKRNIEDAAGTSGTGGSTSSRSTSSGTKKSGNSSNKASKSSGTKKSGNSSNKASKEAKQLAASGCGCLVSLLPVAGILLLLILLI